MIERPRIDSADLDIWWLGVADLMVAEARYAEDAEERASLLMEAARVLDEECGELDRAVSLYAQIQRSAPGARGVYRALVNLFRRQEDWGRARSTLEDAIRDEASADERASLRLELAEIQAMQQGDRGAALETLWAALDEMPSSHQALLMVAVLLEPGDVDGQGELIRRRLALVDDAPGRLNLLLQLGHVESLRGERNNGALEAYREAYALAPDNGDAITGLYRCLLERSDWPSLLSFLTEVTEGATEEAPARFSLLLEVIRNEHFGETSSTDTIHALERWALEDPTAYAELTHLADNAGVPLAMLAPGDSPLTSLQQYRAGLVQEEALHYEAAADNYEAARRISDDATVVLHAQRRVSARLDDLHEYAETTEAIAARSDSTELRASLHTHLGMSFEFLHGRPEAAVAHYDKAVGAYLSAIGGAPVHEIPALMDLVRVLEKTLEPSAFDAALGELINDCAEPSQIAQLYDRRAELALRTTRDTDQAVRYYEQVVHFDPDNLHAHRVLQDVYRRRRDWPRLMQSIEDELKEASGARRLQLLHELAEIHLQLGAPASAEDAWRQALHQDPNWFPAHMGLGQMLDGQGRWRELAEQLSFQLSTLPPDSGQRTSLLGRLAEIYEFRLDLPDRAEAAYLELLARKEAAPDAIAGLERVYSQTGNWTALVEVLEGVVEAAESTEAKAALHIRIADLLHIHLSDLTGARDHYATALALAPALPRARWGLEWLLIESGDHVRLAQHYRDAVEAEPDEAHTLLHKHIVIAPTAEAEALAEQIRMLDSTDHLALWVTLVSAAERGADEDVSRILVTMSESLDSRRVRQMLVNEAAERLPSTFEAERRGLWEQMVQLAPENERGWQALLALYGEAGEPTALRDYLHRLQASISHVTSRSTAFWVSALLAEKAGDRTGFYQDLRKAYGICPDDVIPLWLMLHHGVYEDAAEQSTLMERLAERLNDRKEAGRLYFEAGRIRTERLQDQHQAATNFRLALRADPGLQAAADQLEQILIGQDRLDDIFALNLQRARSAEDPELRAALLLRCARAERRLNDRPEGAVDLLKQLLEEQPQSVAGLRELAETLVTLGRGTEAIPYYESLIDQAQEDTALGTAFLELGRLRLQTVGPAEETLECFRRAVGVSSSPEALMGLGHAYYLAGDFDLAQLTFRRLERMDAPASAHQVAILGQIEALLAAERPAEALRRLKRLDTQSVLSKEALARAARLLVEFSSMPSELHSTLSTLVTKREPSDPEVTSDLAEVSLGMAEVESMRTAAAVTSQPPSAELSVLEPSGSEPTSMIGYAINIQGDGTTTGASESRVDAPSTPVQELTSPVYWGHLADQHPDLTHWYQEIGNWTCGEMPSVVLPAMVGPLERSIKHRALPDSLPAAVADFVGDLLRTLNRPLVAMTERAEIAAEGQFLRDDEVLSRRFRAFTEAVGLDDAVLVRSAARPYGLDIFRKASPIVTFGASLIGGLDSSRASFLIGATTLPLAEGLLPPRFTAVGRGMDDERFGVFLESAIDSVLKTALGDAPASSLHEQYRTFCGPLLDSPEALKSGAEACQAFLAKHGTAGLRADLDRYLVRLAAVMADSLGGALDILRQLDFDDRPRSALTESDVRSLVRDNESIRDLLEFAATDHCRVIRRALKLL